MARIPLLSGSRVPLVTTDDDVLLLTPPPPLDPLRDVAAAVGEALRYPLSGPRLAGSRHPRRPRHDRRRASLPAAAGRTQRPASGGARRRHRRARAPRDGDRQAHDPDRRRSRAPRRTPRARSRPPPQCGRATSGARSWSTTRRAPTCGRSSSRAPPPVRDPPRAARGRSHRVRHRCRDLRAGRRLRAPRCLRRRGHRLAGAGTVAARTVALAHRRARRQGRGSARSSTRPSRASRSCSTIRA